MLQGKVVLITGASSGIGEAAARAFDAAGAIVILAARRIEKLERIASSLKTAVSYPVDLSDPGNASEMIDRVTGKFGRIDVFISNAASIIVSPAETVSSGDLQNAFTTNLLSPVAACQRALHYMKQQNQGHIIIVGSPGFMMGIPFYAPYVCSKAALSAWTRTIQAEWNFPGITVSEYCPGYISTHSKPESRIGEVDQNFLMSEKQNMLTRKFAKPKTPETVAKQLVRLAENPKTLAYSGLGVKIGAFISNIPGFRLNLARQMANTAKLKLKDNPIT
ncbi:MAG: SDR family NAD(P)-dependent oxidoreductase [Syntrophothermus sp.]